MTRRLLLAATALSIPPACAAPAAAPQPEHADDDDGGGAGGDAAGEPDDEAARIDAWVLALGTEALPPDALDTKVVGEPQDEGDYTCSREDWTETKQFDRITAMLVNSQALYPGALVGSDALATGVLAPKILPRSPLRFSASLEGVLDGAIAATVAAPSLSAFREAMHEILSSEIVGETPAHVDAVISEVHSSEQLGLAIGVDARWGFVLGGEVSASLAFEREQVRSRYAVQFTQAYYTVDVDPPEAPSGLFAPEVTLEDVQGEFGEEAPLYVSSVTYGRSVLFTITSEFSSEELGAALEFAYRGAASVDGSISMTHEEVLASSEITAFVSGGNGEAAAKTIFGVDELREYITKGGSYDRDSPGAAIAYKLAWAADDSPAGFALTSEYEVEQCERVRQDVRVGLAGLKVIDDGGDAGDELELYGEVVVIDGNGDEHALWSTDGDHNVTVGKGEQWPDHGELGSAIVPVVPQPGESIGVRVRLYDDDGVGDDQLLDHTSWRAFEDGWRGELVIPGAEGDQHVEVVLALAPVK
ncbi:MAG: thiol-activated cytolysin family protein [Nannocystaceae bacterium]